MALITGGASGLGAAIALRLAREGARVIAADVQAEAGEALASEHGIAFLRHDVTDEQQWRSVLQRVEAQFGALHILVNNAGIEGSFDAVTPENTRLSEWQAIQRVNVEGVFLGCRAAIPVLRRAGGGAIVNVSSTAALVAAPDFVAYGASKGAVLHLTRSVALYCARDGSRIRCNSVHPGSILTPMLRRIMEQTAARLGVAVEAVIDEAKSAIPQGEFQEPEDVASAVLFLASDEARHITGATLVLDGGTTLQVGVPHARH